MMQQEYQGREENSALWERKLSKESIDNGFLYATQMSLSFPI